MQLFFRNVLNHEGTGKGAYEVSRSLAQLRRCVAVCCRVLQCVAVCRSVLQSVKG